MVAYGCSVTYPIVCSTKSFIKVLFLWQKAMTDSRGCITKQKQRHNDAKIGKFGRLNPSVLHLIVDNAQTFYSTKCCVVLLYLDIYRLYIQFN